MAQWRRKVCILLALCLVLGISGGVTVPRAAGGSTGSSSGGSGVYTISFDVNWSGKTGAYWVGSDTTNKNVPPAQMRTEGGKLKTVPVLNADNYVFQGWVKSLSETSTISTGTAFSGPTTVHALWKNKVTGVSISGTAQVGQKLTASVTPSGATVSYQWKAGGAEISGATSSEYTPAAADVGKTITVTVTGSGSYDGTTTSTATAAVAAAGYTITFDANGGTIAAADATKTTGADGKLSSLPTPTRSGYTFAGWYTKKTDGEIITTSSKFGSKYTVYAHWTPNSGTTVAMDSFTIDSATRNRSYTYYLTDDLPGCTSFSASGLPSGLSLSTSGKITGSPTVSGSRSFTIAYKDSSGTSRSSTVRMTIYSSSSSYDDYDYWEWADTGYEITEHISWRSSYYDNCFMTSRGSYSEFKALYIDSTKLVKGTDYRAWSGSTHVEIYSRALRDAGKGYHTVKMEFKDSSGITRRAEQSVYLSSSSSGYDDEYAPKVTVNNDKGGTARAYSSGEVQITAYSGYHVSSVTVNGKTVTLPSNGRLTGLHSSDRVVVTFEADSTKNIIVTPNSQIGVPPSGYSTTGISFSDVPGEAYYYSAVQWAVTNRIAKGAGNNSFRPNSTCTRADMMTFLWRACGSPEPSGGGKQFVDVPSGAYYEKAVKWAAGKDLVKGKGGRRFNPGGLITRGEAVTFLYRAAGSPATNTGVKFEDVKSGAYYLKPVYWALNNSVAAGVSSGYFRPERACTRGEVVTFLYRRYSK